MEKENSGAKQKLAYDVAVIGGGPAGMMSAIHAGKEGASVVLIEKNKTLGKKLLITGGGRCNVTNAIFDNRALAQKYGKKGTFLLSPFSKWNAKDTIDFFETREMPTKEEALGRVFPKSNSAQSVLDVLLDELENANVKIITDSPAIKVKSLKDKIIYVETDNAVISAKTFIFTTGGTARPETGSSGDGFKWLKKLGHTISAPSVALVPVKIKEAWVHRLQGLSLPDVKITLIDAKSRGEARIGKILFTHFGLSGPLALGMSQAIGEGLREGMVTLELDLFPTLDQVMLDEKLRAHLAKVQNKKWANALAGFVSPLLAPVLVELSGINPTMPVNKVPRLARLAFIRKLKSLTLTPSGLLGVEKAIVSSGGVALEEVDFKTMRSQKIENLCLAGDILDFDRPSGGFSLQICWTTGFVAGKSAGVYNNK
ncbi:MAG TPA: aminoacetone oxidase family FAD-binding enzyme [Candidatus Yonathbacteria bacterium]|nr:aminoacetone oxidase family FAD-binding enzyme [Candidatus Yonathbacteria bacterium]